VRNKKNGAISHPSTSLTSSDNTRLYNLRFPCTYYTLPAPPPLSLPLFLLNFHAFTPSSFSAFISRTSNHTFVLIITPLSEVGLAVTSTPPSESLQTSTRISSHFVLLYMYLLFTHLSISLNKYKYIFRYTISCSRQAGSGLIQCVYRQLFRLTRSANNVFIICSLITIVCVIFDTQIHLNSASSKRSMQGALHQVTWCS